MTHNNIYFQIISTILHRYIQDLEIVSVWDILCAETRTYQYTLVNQAARSPETQGRQTSVPAWPYYFA
jgi:hypothetical protein